MPVLSLRPAFMGIPAVNHGRRLCQRPMKELLVGRDDEAVRDSTIGVRQHAVLGDDGVTLDAVRTRHGCPPITQQGWAANDVLRCRSASLYAAAGIGFDRGLANAAHLLGRFR